MKKWYLSIRNNKAYTLGEIIVVVIIMGALASLAIPKLTRVFERVRASEGVQLLTALLGAQKTYEFENGAFATDPDDLDINIPLSTNFDVTSVAANAVSPIAEITRWNSYTLGITPTGVITCDNTGAVDFFCVDAGY